jgi:putative ABC transport system permease protein
MGYLASIARRFALLARRRRFRSELDEEMAFHRANAEADFATHSMSPAEAHRAAARQFGNPAVLQDRSQAIVGFRFETIVQDLRFALRQMRHSPGFTLAVVLTLALGIGATTAIFSLVHATLLRKLPYPESDRIIAISDVRPVGESTGGLVGIPRFYDLQARSRSFESLAFYCFEKPTIVVDGNLPEQLDGNCVTGQFWRVLGVQPMLGRTFDENTAPASAPQQIVLSYGVWQRLFAADPGVIGKSVTVDKLPATVVAVMPREFVSPGQVDMWRLTAFELANWREYRGDGTRFANVLGRLKPGVTVASARSELDVIGSRLAVEHSDSDGPWRFAGLSLRDDLYGSVRPALLVLMAASLLLLLIACVNVANLLLSRAASRRREIAVRRALGASQRRIVTQMLTESILLSLLGAGAGLAVSSVLLRLSDRLLHHALDLPENLAPGWPVLIFTCAISIATGVLFGVAPIWENRSNDMQRNLKVGEVKTFSGGGRARSAFISIQVGLSLILLAGACLLAESMWKLTRAPLGFTPQNILSFSVQLPWNGAKGADLFFAEVERRIEGLPGVSAAGQISALPTANWHVRTSYDVDWNPRTAHHDAVSAEVRVIGGEYTRAMEIPIVAGRDLRLKESGAVLVNEEFSRRYFAVNHSKAALIGHHVTNVDGQNAQIVGVLGNVRGTAGSLASGIEPEVYYSAEGLTNRWFVVRSSLPPAVLTAAIREQVHQVDPLQSIGSVDTLDDMLDVSVAKPRLNMALMAAFAVIALVLACVGIYGVVAYSVTQRRQEIGVRMALGASRRQISQLFLKHTLSAALIGLACGALLTLPLTSLLRSQLYGVQPNDPVTLLFAVLLLLIPVFAASLRPALKAASVNPVEALRSE